MFAITGVIARRNAILCAATVLLSGVIIAPAREAQAVVLAAPASTSITGTMVPDCTKITPAVRKYIAENQLDICSVATTLKSGSLLQPNGTVTGLCGSSTILLQRMGPTRVVAISYGFYSSIGNAVFRSLLVSYSVGSGTGGFSDVSFMNHYVYSGSRRVEVGPGTMRAALGGTITLSWGLVCYMKGPTATIVT